jgi:lipid-A-disaccharide synthase
LSEVGQEQFAKPSDLAVMGFWEVAQRYGYFRKLFHRCIREIEERRPSAILLVDYPGFNLRLARALRELHIPVLYYIAPQVWAWGSKRTKEIRKNVDKLIVILPFEEEFFRNHDIDCTFVGHYLLEDMRDEFVSSEPPEQPQLALLPGSRSQEVQRMLPVMLEAAAELCRRHDARAVVAGVTDAYDYEAALAPYRDDGLDVAMDNSRQVVHDSHLVLTASGTATLETGIIGRPMVVLYKTGWVTFQIARRLVRLRNIALVNLVLGSGVVPELLQGQARKPELVAALDALWDRGPGYQEQRRELTRVPGLLGGDGASQRAANVIAEYL